MQQNGLPDDIPYVLVQQAVRRSAITIRRVDNALVPLFHTGRSRPCLYYSSSFPCVRADFGRHRHFRADRAAAHSRLCPAADPGAGLYVDPWLLGLWEWLLLGARHLGRAAFGRRTVDAPLLGLSRRR